MSTDSPPPSLSALRKLLAVEFPEFAAFKAFLCAAYPEVYHRASDGMDRTAVTNLLFQIEGGERAEIVAAIGRHRQGPLPGGE